MATHYELLGIRADATQSTIDRAFKRLEIRAAESETELEQAIAVAYAVLSDPESRELYNQDLRDELNKEIDKLHDSYNNLSDDELSESDELRAKFSNNKNSLTLEEIEKLRGYNENIKIFTANKLPTLRQLVDLSVDASKPQAEQHVNEAGKALVEAINDLKELERLANRLANKPAEKVQVRPQKAAPIAPSRKRDIQPPNKPAPLPPKGKEEVSASEPIVQQPARERPIPPPRKDVKASTERARAASAEQPPARQAAQPPRQPIAPPVIAVNNAPRPPSEYILKNTEIGRAQKDVKKLLARSAESNFRYIKIARFDKAVKAYNKINFQINKLSDESMKTAFQARQKEIRDLLNVNRDLIGFKPAKYPSQTTIQSELETINQLIRKAEKATDLLDKTNYYLEASEKMNAAFQKAERKYNEGSSKYSKHTATMKLAEKLQADLEMKVQQSMEALAQARDLLAKSKKPISLRDNPAFKDLANVRLYVNKALKADSNPKKRAEYIAIADQHMRAAKDIIARMPISAKRNNAEALCLRYNNRLDKLTTYTKTALTLKERFFEPSANDAMKAKHFLMDALREIKKGEDGKKFSSESVQKLLASAKTSIDKANNSSKRGHDMDEFIGSMQRKYDELNNRLQQLEAPAVARRPRM